jgi:hypothetical protein
MVLKPVTNKINTLSCAPPDSVEDRAEGLDSGADDDLAEPFASRNFSPCTGAFKIETVPKTLSAGRRSAGNTLTREEELEIRTLSPKKTCKVLVQPNMRHGPCWKKVCTRF